MSPCSRVGDMPIHLHASMTRYLHVGNMPTRCIPSCLHASIPRCLEVSIPRCPHVGTHLHLRASTTSYFHAHMRVDTPTRLHVSRPSTPQYLYAHTWMTCPHTYTPPYLDSSRSMPEYTLLHACATTSLNTSIPQRLDTSIPKLGPTRLHASTPTYLHDFTPRYLHGSMPIREHTCLRAYVPQHIGTFIP